MNFLSDTDFAQQYGSTNGAPVLSDQEFQAQYGGAGEDKGFLSSAYDATMGGVGKAFGLASYPLNALARTVGRAEGIPVSDEATMGTMLSGALGPTQEYTKEHPFLGGLAKGGLEETGNLIASGPLMALGTARLPAAIGHILTTLFAAGAVGEAKHVLDAWKSGNQEELGKAIAGVAGFGAGGYAQHKLGKFAHPSELQMQGPPDFQGPRGPEGEWRPNAQGEQFEMQPPPAGYSNQPTTPLNEIPTTEAFPPNMVNPAYDYAIEQVRNLHPRAATEAQGALDHFTQATEGRMEAPAKFYDAEGRLREDLSSAEIHQLWEEVAQARPDKYPSGYDSTSLTQDPPPDIAGETLGKEMGIKLGKRAATQAEISAALKSQKGEVYNRYLERMKEGGEAAPSEQPLAVENPSPTRGVDEAPIGENEVLPQGAEGFNPDEFTQSPQPPTAAEKIPFEILPEKGQMNLPPHLPTFRSINDRTKLRATNSVRKFFQTALGQLKPLLRGGEETGIFPDKGTASDVAAAKITDKPTHANAMAEFLNTAWAQKAGEKGFSLEDALKVVGNLNVDPTKLANNSKNPLDFVHQMVGALAHELAHGRKGSFEHSELWGTRGNRGETVSDPGALIQSSHEGDFSLKVQMDIIRQKLYQTPIINNLLESAQDPTSPINQIFHTLNQDSKWGGEPAKTPVPYEGFMKELESRKMQSPPKLPTMEEGFSKAKGEAVGEANIADEPAAMQRKALVEQQRLAMGEAKNPFGYDLSRGKGDMIPPPKLPSIEEPSGGGPGGGEPPSSGGGKEPEETGPGKGPITKSEYLNVPRSLMTAADVSYVFRQAIIPALRHPKLAYDAFLKSLSAFKSATKANELMQELAASPEWATNGKEGVHWTQHDGKTPEEAFYGSRVIREWFKNLEKIHPDASKYNWVEASERSFTYFLNKIRQDVHTYNRNQLTNLGFKEGSYVPGTKDWVAGENDSVFRKAASWANVITGRGEYPKGPGYVRETLRSSQGLLNAIMFSPRMMIARLTALNPKTYYDYFSTAKQSSGSTSMAAKATLLGPVLDMATFMAIASTVTAATAAAVGGSVEKDPRSSDFMKVKVGNTRFDLFGGFLPFVRTAAQFVTNERKTKYGNIQGTTKQDVMSSFLRGRLAPIPALTVDALAGKDITGSSFWGPTPDIASGRTPLTGESAGDVVKTLGSQVGQDIFPLAYQDIVKAYQEDPWVGLASIIPSLTGVGVSTHTPLFNKKVQNEFYRVGASPPAELSAIKLGENWENKPVSYKMTYEESKHLTETTDPTIYRGLEQVIDSPQYQQLSPKLQQILLEAAVKEMNNYRSEMGKAMVPPPKYRELLTQGSEVLSPQSGPAK